MALRVLHLGDLEHAANPTMRRGLPPPSVTKPHDQAKVKSEGCNVAATTCATLACMALTTKTDTMELRARKPFSGGTQAYSGATFERAVLGDGRSVILKHLPPDGDWLTRATDGIGRARLLWESGVLARAGDAVEHAVLDVVEERDHDVVVMEDVSDVLLPPDVRISASEVDRLLAGLARLHAAFEGCPPDSLCSPGARNSIFVPTFHRDDNSPHGLIVRDHVLAGWEAFAEKWPRDIVDAILALHDDPGLLDQAFATAAPWTLLHGDAKLDNLGLRGDRLVAIDWGELTGTGPAEMDLVWFSALGTGVLPGAPTWRIDAMPDEVFALYAARSGRPLDRGALDLACLGMVAQSGWHLCAPMGEDWARARTAQLEAWWLVRAGEALETWSPT